MTIKKLPNEADRYNCVKFARRYVPSLPFGLWTLTDKKKIINSYAPTVGDVAIMSVGLFGHVGVVQEISGEIITIKEANYKTGQITERSGTASELKIVGYFNPNPKPKDKNECYGIDVSHWQNKIDWGKVKTDFAIMKATQGVNISDSTLAYNRENARKNGILCGYYHFSDGGDVRKEANWFLKNIGDLQKGELLVLDWEISHKDPAGWCRDFILIVKEKTGIIPILYTNEARVKSINWKPVIDINSGLWVAKYGTNNGLKQTKPASGQWPFYVIWQYTSKGTVNGIKGCVDLNYCSCSIETLKKYGKK